MKKSIVIFLSITTSLIACGPSQKITSSWLKSDRPQKTYQKVFIAALVQNTEVKVALENDLAAAAQSKGYSVIKSLDLFPPNFTRTNMPDKETVLNKIKSLGCDAIFTVAIVNKESETRYVPGSAAYTPYRAYGRGFWGYYNFAYPSLYTPGYYTTDKTYFMEANAFDVATEEMVWSVQSEAYNPSSKAKFSKEYAAILLQQFNKQIKK